MQQNECTRNCWIAAGVIGLLVWIFTSFIGQTSMIGGLFLGLITTVLMGLLLVWALCKGSGSAADDRQHSLARARPMSTPMPLQSAAPAAAPAPAAVAAAPAKAAAVEAKPEPKAAAPTPLATPPAAREAEPAPKPAVAKKAEPKAVKKSEPKAEAKPAATKAAKPAKAKPDDLKQIKGVGPKLEQLLHENGITQFAQIAAWTDAQIDDFAEKIGSMGGRIRSDDWLAQAKILAEGGSTEFAQRVKKGDVY